MAIYCRQLAPVPGGRPRRIGFIATTIVLAIASSGMLTPGAALGQTEVSREQAVAAMRRAGEYFHNTLAVRGGYVYRYSVDLKRRWGEGVASPTEIWVQPPGTPAVGEAFLDAYEATGDQLFLKAARDAAGALIDGQLVSGGWSSSIEFDPRGKHADLLRSGKGKKKGRNYSTLDDDKSQSALCFLMRLDKTTHFKDEALQEPIRYGLSALLAAQFPNGGFPQGWKQAVGKPAIRPASFPDYDWRTENRIKEYWDYYTLNDGLAGTVARTLDLAHQTYNDARYEASLRRLGDFLILAQMPEPQPAWAQQYNFDMHPMWARKFEPPAIVGIESEDVIATLMFVYEKTGDSKYLRPIPAALDWLERSQLDNGQIARYYELRTNRPLYMTRDYQLTYDDNDLPTHYGFKTKTRRESLRRQFEALQKAPPTADSSSSASATAKRKTAKSSDRKTSARQAAAIIKALDSQGRWLSEDATEIHSEDFIRNMRRLSAYVKQ